MIAVKIVGVRDELGCMHEQKRREEIMMMTTKAVDRKVTLCLVAPLARCQYSESKIENHAQQVPHHLISKI